MRPVSNLPAIRWLRSALKELPSPRLPRQSVAERCREEFAEEAQWFSERIARHNKRKD